MPRPGPRPYECVRRAWHSDRHQPIRGSLIQEIFRVANEVHSPATRKNKEWQEKLPLVVLKAEEIMYSKANSEAEYMDAKTLWQRANDAIDTIIRRDDTPETEGDFLQPCIEAALNLGCVPRRASRSQRHNNPGCYLSTTTTREATVAVSVKISESSKPSQHLVSSAHLLPPSPPQSSHPQNFPSQLASWYSALATPTNVNYMTPEVKSVIPSTSCEPKDAFSIYNHAFGLPSLDSINPCQDGARSVPAGTYTCMSFGRVYPLYYSNDQPRKSSQPSLLSPQDPLGNIVAASVSSLPSICEAGMGSLHNFIGRNNTRDASNTSSNFEEASDNPSNTGCDLSLRLGLYSPPSLDTESAWTTEVEDVGSSSSCDGSKFSDPSPRTTRAANFESSFSSSKDKGFDFFQVDTTDEPLESCSSKWSSEGEGNATRRAF